jgi:hypothetical protein
MIYNLCVPDSACETIRFLLSIFHFFPLPLLTKFERVFKSANSRLGAGANLNQLINLISSSVQSM